MIERIVARIGVPPPGELWSGDDAALFASPGKRLLWTTDSLVEGSDFELTWAAGFDVGWKSIAINVSDIAAMGARPTHATTVLSLRPDTPVELFDDLLEGLARGAAEWGVGLVGGDIGSAPELAIAVSMLGTPVVEAVTRAGARPGDAICVTGTLGGAAGGLELLRAYEDEANLSLPAASNLRRSEKWPQFERLLRRQLQPRARLEEGIALARSGATAMIDVSDGLVIDLDRVMAASGTGCEIELSALPIDPDRRALHERVEMASTDVELYGELPVTDIRAATTGGEDFELLATVPPEQLDEAASELGSIGTPFTRIGTVTDGEKMIGDRTLERWKEEFGAWDHLLRR